MNTTTQGLLLLCRHAPYQGQLARGALDAALAAAVFDLPVSLLFMDDAVWQLLGDQQANEIQRKSQASALDSLALYDVDQLFVDEGSLVERGLVAGSLRQDVDVLAQEALPGFLERFDKVWSF